MYVLCICESDFICKYLDVVNGCERYQLWVATKQSLLFLIQIVLLGNNFGALNQSLDVLVQMKEQLASFVSVMDNLDPHLEALSKTVGNTVLDNTDIQDTIQGFGDKILQFGVIINYCNMYICIYTHMYAYTYTCTHTCTHILIYKYSVYINLKITVVSTCVASLLIFL